MSVQEIADNADMIVAGYAYKIIDDYIEVTDLNDTSKRAIIQNGDVVESLMDDNEDEIVLTYYQRNKDIMKAFTDDDTYDDRFPVTSKQKHIYKTTEGGIKVMCDIIKRNREEAAAEAAAKATKEATKKEKISNLKNLMKNMKWTSKQAMDALGIPDNEQSFYANALL